MAFIPSLSWAVHGSWHDHYTDAGGIPCCATAQDCVPQPVRIISQSATHIVVEIGGWFAARQVQIQQGSLHLSETTQDWVCWKRSSPFIGVPAREPRCVFIAPGT